ncbi:MAG: Rossman fold protein, TIGR00730 family [Phycisphaerae bacterium]|nr:MAG: Rossman fold protein, TIGR00730 family [Phycisphaerae bacterium]
MQQAQSPDQIARRQARGDSIRAFLDEFAPGDNQDLLAEMMVTICRLSQDDASRGDIKVLNQALKELRYAYKVFAPYDGAPKCTIFGSARTREDHPQYIQCVKFAQLMQKQGWMVITGAGDGIMRAGHHGATRESSFGVAISLPFEQSTNTIIEGDPKLVNFKYFFTRKLMFLKEAEAVILFPGGFGTQDEGFEALTLIQTGKSVPVPVVLVDEPDGTYWQHWRTYVQSELLRTGMIGEDDMSLFSITDNADEAVAEILHFYHRYHSSRFVNDELVIRMKTSLPSALVDKLNDDYEDLLKGGDIRQVNKALHEEAGEFADLPRLVFNYDKKSAGRLRQMINEINNCDVAP